VSLRKVKDLKNEGWLGDLEIEAENTGNKPIYFLRLGLIFADVREDSGNEIGYSLVYGRGQLIDIGNRAEDGDISILPGGTYVFKLHDSYVKGWDWYRTKVEKKPQPKKITIVFGTLNFGDGTGFVGADGTPVPEKQSPASDKKEPSRAEHHLGFRRVHPPDTRPQRTAFFLPAEYSPINFSPAEAVALSRILCK
jgi:hypothetical protein